MFNRLLDSQLKKQLLRTFFTFPARSFYPAELKEITGAGRRKLGQALRELEKEGVVAAFTKKRKKYYRINRHLKWYDEIKALTEDGRKQTDDPISKRLKAFKNVKLVVLTGVLAGQPRVETDLLLVSSKLTPSSLKAALADIKKLIGQEVNYTIMDPEEFEYRQQMRDRFIRDILDNPHIEVLNKLKKKKNV